MKKKTLEPREYPYQKRSLKDLNGEQWDDIPGLDGYYRVSSFGRIKRLKREVVNSNGIVITLSECIRAVGLCKSPNEEMGDCTMHLLASIQLNKKSYRFSVRRLVYCCFVKPFALDDPAVYIIPKNGNGLDIRPCNLKMIASAQQRKLTYFNQRRTSTFKGHYAEEIKRASVAACQKQVSQYSKTGKRMNTYASAREAERRTGIAHSSVALVANGGKLSAGGFFWRYGNSKKIDVNAWLEKRRKGYKPMGIGVTQYDLRGNKIAEHSSMLKAEQATGICNGSIRMVTLGRYQSAGGYYWKKGQGPASIDLSGHKAGRDFRVKKVNQYTLQGNYLCSFDSIREAAAAVQVTDNAVSAACKGLLITCKGYQWRFA